MKYIEKNNDGSIKAIYANPQFSDDGSLRTIQVTDDNSDKNYQFHLLSEAKASKTKEIKLARNSYLYKNITLNSRSYKATRDAKLLFFSKVNGMTAIHYPLDWRLSDDITWVQLTKEEAYQLYDLFEEREKLGYEYESELLTALKSATTIEEVNAITWDLE